MKSGVRDRLTVLVVLLIPIAVVLLTGWAIFYPIMDRASERRKQPRRMFNEWRDTDWGPAWCMVDSFRDEFAVSAIADPPLNIVVVFAVSEKIDLGPCDLRVDHAVFREGRTFETKVAATENVLVWIGRDQRLDLDLAPGRAQEIHDSLRQSDYTTLSVLGTIVRLYSGRDRSKLKQCVADYSAVANAPTSAPTQRDP